MRDVDAILSCPGYFLYLLTFRRPLNHLWYRFCLLGSQRLWERGVAVLPLMCPVTLSM